MLTLFLQNLFERSVSPDDQKSIVECVAKLKKDFLPDDDPLQIRAAVDIRLRRFGELKKIYGLDESDSLMYGIVTSRAIELADGFSAVIPMFDMVNHSMDPNLILSLDWEGEMLDLKATRRIKKGDEMFICYHDEENPDKEFESIWVRKSFLCCHFKLGCSFTIIFHAECNSMGYPSLRFKDSRANGRLILVFVMNMKMYKYSLLYFYQFMPNRYASMQMCKRVRSPSFEWQLPHPWVPM